MAKSQRPVVMDKLSPSDLSTYHSSIGVKIIVVLDLGTSIYLTQTIMKVGK